MSTKRASKFGAVLMLATQLKHQTFRQSPQARRTIRAGAWFCSCLLDHLYVPVWVHGPKYQLVGEREHVYVLVHPLQYVQIVL